MKLAFVCITTCACGQDLFISSEGISGYTDLGGDCPGNNIDSHKKVNAPIDCSAFCESTPSCAGFSFNVKKGSCVTKSDVCTEPKTGRDFEFYRRDAGPVGPTPTPTPVPTPPPPPPSPSPSPPTPTPTPPSPPPSGGIPTVSMKNAAKAGMEYPMMGLGVEGRGFEGGPSSLECWKWPQCEGPPQDAVVNYIQEAVSRGGVARIDTGYPYGDNSDKGCPSSPPKFPEDIDDDDVDFDGSSDQPSAFLSSHANASLSSTGGHDSCDTYGHGIALKRALKSGVKRDQLFVTIKVGYAAPMGKQDTQIKSDLKHLGLDYADLCLIHLPESGKNTGNHGQYGDMHCASGKKDYDPKKCRINTYNSMLNNLNAGRCHAIGVANWNAEHLQELVDAKVKQMPSVVQFKFHLHNSMSNSVVNDLVAFTQKHNIVFNGYGNLGVPDWVTFQGEGMTSKLLDEPVVKDIATKHSKTPAQVLLRWSIEQGFPTHARTMKESHMKDNLDIFGFSLDSDDMSSLNSLPQCNVQIGNPFPVGSPDGGQRHDGVYGMTEHC